MTEANTWRKYLTDYNEGLGLVYERFVLNDFLDDLRRRQNIRSVLEAPLYGMAGVSGINDVMLARTNSRSRPAGSAMYQRPAHSQVRSKLASAKGSAPH